LYLVYQIKYLPNSAPPN